MTTPPDAGISEWVTGLVGKCSVCDNVMALLATDFFIPVAISLYMLFLWFGIGDGVQRVKNQYGAMCASISLGIACGMVEIFNAIFEVWERPFVEGENARHAAETLFYLPHDPSFPSNLAAVGFGAAMGMWMYNRKAAIPIFALASLWSISRVYAGIHYPVDILGGAAIGIAVAFFSYGLLKVLWPFPIVALWIARKLYIA